MTIPALGGAAAALVVPGASSTANAGATLLAVGALAMLAGHTWGLMVVVPSHLSLVGRLWPAFALGGPADAAAGGQLGSGAIVVVLLTALPALTLAAILMPKMVNHLLVGKSPRTQGLVVAGVALLLAAWLVLPAV